MSQVSTTFALLKQHGACTVGYKKLAAALGGVTKYGRNVPIPLARIVDTNGIEDALWCLQAVLPEQEGAVEKMARLFACDCAEHVLHIYLKDYPNDKRPRQAIETARRFANGQATREELNAAWAAAFAAAWDAAWDAARDAAWAAAWAAARAAAGAAAWAAARAAEREYQKERFLHYLNEFAAQVSA